MVGVWGSQLPQSKSEYEGIHQLEGSIWEVWSCFARVGGRGARPIGEHLGQGAHGLQPVQAVFTWF